MRENFGQYVHDLRLRKNLSQRALARLSGLNHSEISRIEGGSRPTPSPDSLAKLAPHLGVTHEELMRRLGYLSSSPQTMLEEGFRRALDENEALRYLVMQLTDRRLSRIGQEYLSRMLTVTCEHLDRLEQGLTG